MKIKTEIHLISLLPLVPLIDFNINTEYFNISINFEEYEAINLCDYEFLTQAEAAKLMKVSRPTFTRIYESVRRKIAKAFVEGSCIHFEGGNVSIADWFKCHECKITFTLPENTTKHDQKL